MARGYLGKISAVVSANTGDYVRKLNDSAARTREFAQGIQGDLRRASAQVSQTFSRILTPIQQFERAIQNASSQRLKFNGFDGAIRTVQELRKRIGELENQADIDFVVSASGLKNLTELKKTLAGLRDSDVDLAIRVGADGIRALLADVQEIDGKVVNVKTKIEASRLEMILAKIDKLDGNQIRRLQIAVEDRQLTQAEQQARRLFGLAREIGEPLAQAAADFDKLPLAVQAAFPVLQRVQDEFERIDAAIRSNGAVGEQEYQRLADSADKAARSIREVSALQARVSELSGGGDLGLMNPSLDAALTRAQGARRRALEAPLDVRIASGQGISGLLADIKLVGEEAVRLDATMRSGLLPSTAANEKAFAGLVAQINAAVDLIDEVVPLKVETTGAKNALDDIQKRTKEIKDALQFTLTGDVQNIRQAASEYNRLRGEVEKFDAARRQAFAGGLQAVADIIAAEDETQLANVILLLRQIGDEVENQKKIDLGAKKQADDVERLRNAMQSISDSIGEPAAPIDRLKKNVDEATAAVKKLTGAQRQRADQALANLKAGIDANQGNANYLPLLARRAGIIRDAAVAAAPPPRSPSGPPVRNPLGDPFSAATAGGGLGLNPARLLSGLASAINSVKSSLDDLPVSVQVRFIPAIKSAEDEFARLAAAPNATATAVENAARKVAVLKDEAERAAAASKLVSFDKLSETAGIERTKAEVKALGDIMINVGARPGSALAAAFDRVNKVVADGIARNLTGTKAWQRQYEGVRDAAVRAAASTGKISQSTAQRTIARAGDVGRAGFDKFALAAQQAGFALDDFFSVTGGFDQRLRAIANNVSQLGFILGGTSGLFAALGVTIGTQVLIPIVRFVFSLKQGEDAAKAMNAAVDSQRDKIKELADAYKELARSIASSGMSDSGRRDFERAGERRRREADQAALALDATAANSPRLAAARGAVSTAATARGNATTVQQFAAAARAEQEARRNLNREEVRARTLASSQAGSFSLTQLRQQRAAERRGLRAEENRINDIGTQLAGYLTLGLIRPAAEARAASRRERLGQLEGAITLSQQRQAESFIQRGQRLSDRFAPLQEGLSGTETQSRIDRLFARFSETADQLVNGLLSPNEVAKAQSRFERLSADLERTAIAVSGFAQALDSQAGRLAESVVSDARGREEQLRRQANAAEAQFGAGDPRTAGLRRDEQQATESRRRIERERSLVERKIFEERQRFEQDLLSGRAAAEDRQRAADIQRQRAIAADESKTADQRAAARLEAARLEQQQSQAFEGRSGVQSLRRRADELDIQGQRDAQQIEARQRGRDLALSDRERRAREIQQSARDIGAAFPEVGVAGVQGAARNLVDQLTPAFASLRDEALNARLQGPSRAALTVSDISTAEGARELNRLLRGDDQARDVNFLELQKQSGLLQDIKTAIEQETNVVVDL